MDTQPLWTRRAEIMKEMGELGEMRRGSVVEQFQERVRPDGRIVRHGPYPLYSYKEKGRTISRRLKTSEEADRYRQQIRNFRRFEELTRELVMIGEQLSDAETGADKKKD